MTTIAVKYKRSTTGEDIPPPSRTKVLYTRPDGRPANEGEITRMTKAFARAMTFAGEKAKKTGKFIEPQWAVGGYQIEVLRDDDLPLSIHDVQCTLLMDTMHRNNQMQEVEVIVTTKATQIIVSNLPAIGVKTWAAVTQQLEAASSQEESDDEGMQANSKYYEQVVRLHDAEGAQMLMDVGLITRDDTNDATQYIVPRTSAYCTTEWRR